MYRVLSIDGGGIRGIIPAFILSEIERCTNRPTASLFDLIVGTSTGGILGLALSVPDADQNPRFAAKTGIELYEAYGEIVFPPPVIPVWSEFRLKLLDEKYPSDGLVRTMTKLYGNTRMQEALTTVVITTYDLTDRKPRFFKSDRDGDKDFLMWQVARSTAAAPTFFEPHLMLDPTGPDHALVDGGVFANNPAMCAYAEALERYQEPEDIMLVSLGTGYGRQRIPYEDARDWGQLQWALPLIKIFMDSMGATVNYQLQRILPDRGGRQQYFRLQAPLDSGHEAMDNISVDNIRYLRFLAKKIVDDAKRNGSFDRLCKQLLWDN